MYFTKSIIFTSFLALVEATAVHSSCYYNENFGPLQNSTSHYQQIFVEAMDLANIKYGNLRGQSYHNALRIKVPGA